MIKEVAIANKHLEMERDFLDICKERGYSVVDLSYHHNFSDDRAEALRRDFSPASLSVRTSPDMLVQKSSNNLYKSFFVELKTGNTRNVIQMEAFQLMHNKVLEKQMWTPCIYVYRGALSDYYMIACHAKDIRVSKLVLPDAFKNTQVNPILQNFFEVPTETRPFIQGFSNDPYVEVSDIKNWLPIDSYMC